MHVWVLSNEYHPRIIGGLGIVATNLTHALARGGVDVTLISNTRRKKIMKRNEETLDIIRFPQKLMKGRQNNPRILSTWLAKNNYQKPDLIHVHSVNFMRVARYYRKKYNIPVIYTCHSLVILEPMSKFRRLVARQQEKLMNISDTIVVPSKWQKAKIKKYYPSLARKVVVVENGIHLCNQASTSPRTRILFVGRIKRLKGIEELVRAVAILSKRESKVRLDVIGTGPAFYLRHLEKLTEQLKIKSKVRWLGFQPHHVVQQLYPHYGAVVVPSKQESFGLVALEALANGVPLVSTRSGGLSQFVNNEVAEVIPQASVVHTAKAIQNMWKRKELTNMRVMFGLNQASQYDWSAITRKYFDIFLRHLNKEPEPKQILAETETKEKDPEWKLKKAWKEKRQGQVWIVENSSGHQGYFKFTRKNQWFFSGPMVANEYIAASLAKQLGFPVAELEEAKVFGPKGELQRGIISKSAQELEVITWQEASLEVKKNPEANIEAIDMLRLLVVFDAWIANIDRASGKNLILYRNSPLEKYKWYLIDHGHTLYGSPRKWTRGKWNSAFWRKLWLYYHVPYGLLRIQNSFSVLEPMIRKIESLRISKIHSAIKTVPKGYLRERERKFTKRLLIYRKRRIRAIMQKWLKYKGPKENSN